ncbi:helix-turn-helix domain-containing protein [Klebsiella variicola]|nr:helix-turn-helix transcriptional regulator [Klebsiella variicola]
MLAQAIKDARKQRNLTQRETAASMGMKQSTVISSLKTVPG